MSRNDVNTFDYLESYVAHPSLDTTEHLHRAAYSVHCTLEYLLFTMLAAFSSPLEIGQKWCMHKHLDNPLGHQLQPSKVILHQIVASCLTTLVTQHVEGRNVYQFSLAPRNFPRRNHCKHRPLSILRRDILCPDRPRGKDHVISWQHSTSPNAV